MHIDIRGNNSLMLQVVRQHVEKRVRLGLGRFAQQITRTLCEIEDANGPRGGVDKVCRVTVHLRSGETVRAEAIHEDFFASVDTAADRLTRSLVRLLSRRRDLARKPRPIAGSTEDELAS